MSHLNIEIKAVCKDPKTTKKVLKQQGAIFKGTDYQIDTYFKVSKGRLKLREGNIENSLIYYKRSNKQGPKQAKIDLFSNPPGSSLKKIFTESLGVLVIVKKKREIYFIGNVKFHIDKVSRLGSFLEIEAIDLKGDIGKKSLKKQCLYFLKLLKIKKDDLISSSYSDMLNSKN